jgi:RNA polymerase sigma-70 factor (ECF subfamily)
VTHRLGVDGVARREVAEPGGATTRAAAFTRLADEHLDASYRLARAIMGGQAEAEDATHDALIQAWRHWSQLRDHTRFQQWFDRILVNTCRDRLRRTRRWSTEDLPPELPTSGNDPIRQADQRDEMGFALAQLSPDHRVVVALRYYRDLQIEEIATALRVSPGTVSSRLHYALRHLRSLLDETVPSGANR